MARNWEKKQSSTKLVYPRKVDYRFAQSSLIWYHQVYVQIILIVQCLIWLIMISYWNFRYNLTCRVLLFFSFWNNFLSLENQSHRWLSEDMFSNSLFYLVKTKQCRVIEIKKVHILNEIVLQKIPKLTQWYKPCQDEKKRFYFLANGFCQKFFVFRSQPGVCMSYICTTQHHTSHIYEVRMEISNGMEVKVLLEKHSFVWVIKTITGEILDFVSLF